MTNSPEIISAVSRPDVGVALDWSSQPTVALAVVGAEAPAHDCETGYAEEHRRNEAAKNNETNGKVAEMKALADDLEIRPAVSLLGKPSVEAPAQPQKAQCITPTLIAPMFETATPTPQQQTDYAQKQLSKQMTWAQRFGSAVNAMVEGIGQLPETQRLRDRMLHFEEVAIRYLDQAGVRVDQWISGVQGKVRYNAEQTVVITKGLIRDVPNLPEVQQAGERVRDIADKVLVNTSARLMGVGALLLTLRSQQQPNATKEQAGEDTDVY